MFLLPLATTVFLGHMFDLRSYDFKTGTVYRDDDIKSLTQITEINELSAEYMLIESEVEYRKFLGLDAATNLKLLVNDYYYYIYTSELNSLMDSLKPNKVHMALKLRLRTVNETVPFDAPQKSGWELRDRWFIGTHYVKSIIYGSDLFMRLFIRTRSIDHKTAIKRSILSTLGRSGTLDESFQEKFSAILKEHDTGYSYSSFGTVPFYVDNVPPTSVNDIIELKKNLSEITETLNGGKGAHIFYEMQPISLLSSKFPLVEINNEIFEKLYDIEKKYEDLRIAFKECGTLLEKVLFELLEDEELKIVAFYEKIDQVISDMERAITLMDISTLGSIDQFSEAMSSYGNTTDTQKYRRKVELLLQQYPTE